MFWPCLYSYINLHKNPSSRRSVAADGNGRGDGALNFLGARALSYLACSHVGNLHVLVRDGGGSSAMRQVVITHSWRFIWARQLRPGASTCDNTRGTWATAAATVAFYNLFIPLSLHWSGVFEGKINFILYLDVKSYGFDRISFQIVLINLLLRRAVRPGGGRCENTLRIHAASYRVLFCYDRCLFLATIGLIERVSINLLGAVQRWRRRRWSR